MSRRSTLALAGVVLLFLGAAARATRGQAADDGYFDAIDHEAIGYRTVVPADPVAQLAQRLASGSTSLAYDNDTGYLPALLRALNIPVSSQLAVFSKTSLQQALISPQNPRAIYFNDAVAVAWPRGGFIEIASHDPRQGVIFYMLPQQQAGQPLIVRRNECLTCHHSYNTGGVPGLLSRSVVTGPRGEAMPFLGNYVVDDRTPLDERWAGWFVTGSTGTARHLGNQTPPATRDLDAQVTAASTSVESFPDALSGYPSQQSDVVAHLVFEHQIHVINLLTRAGWQVRLAEAQHQEAEADAVAQHWADRLVDALLFVDEAPLPNGVAAGNTFTAAFAARGPVDSKGRTLRAIDLKSRLMRYPCSFMIYSEAFDALPPRALSAAYRRLSAVLSGEEKAARYARLAPADRTAIVEILRETKTGLPEAFGQPR